MPFAKPFTLVELLVVIAIVAAAGVGVVLAFAVLPADLPKQPAYSIPAVRSVPPPALTSIVPLTAKANNTYIRDPAMPATIYVWADMETDIPVTFDPTFVGQGVDASNPPVGGWVGNGAAVYYDAASNWRLQFGGVVVPFDFDTVVYGLGSIPISSAGKVVNARITLWPAGR